MEHDTSHPPPNQYNGMGPNESTSTEYRRAFGFDKSDKSTFVPNFKVTNRNPANMKNLLYMSFSNSDSNLHMDWTTSYMHDFKHPVTADRPSTPMTESVEAGTESVKNVEEKEKSGAANAIEGRTSERDENENQKSHKTGLQVTSSDSSPRQVLNIKREESEHGDSMKTVRRYSNYLPNPIPAERRCFDDDEIANPTLKNFINLISRK